MLHGNQARRGHPFKLARLLSSFYEQAWTKSML